MVIIPTEKRFDWNRAPYVLCAIVFVNVLIFFGYQAHDEAKFAEAFVRYAELNYVEYEQPLYQDYLDQSPTLQDNPELKEELQAIYAEARWDELIPYILTDTDFFPYLSENRRNLPASEDFNYWDNRAAIDQQIKSVSYFAYGLTPKDLSLVTLVTSQFLHGDFMHLLGNMLFLVICGFAVEAAIGHSYFLAFYLISGVAGALLHTAFHASSSTPLVGASGAISGVMAMYLGIFQLRRIEFFYWFFIFVGYFRAPALFILPIYIGKELYSYFYTEGSNVAFMDHTGGFIAGALLIFATIKLKPKVLDDDYIEADHTTAPALQQDLNVIYNHIDKLNFTAALKNIDKAIATYGPAFELSRLRYNLLKVDQAEGYEQCVMELLTDKRLRAHQLVQVHDIWQDNPDFKDKLSDYELIDLGWRFTALSDLKTADAIFNSLYEQGMHGMKLSSLATKLGSAHNAQDRPQAKKRYDKLAQKLLEDPKPATAADAVTE